MYLYIIAHQQCRLALAQGNQFFMKMQLAVRVFFLRRHMRPFVLRPQAQPRPRYGVFAPVFTPNIDTPNLPRTSWIGLATAMLLLPA